MAEPNPAPAPSPAPAPAPTPAPATPDGQNVDPSQVKIVDQPPADNSLILGKYKDQSELVEGYKQLQRELSKARDPATKGNDAPTGYTFNEDNAKAYAALGDSEVISKLQKTLQSTGMTNEAYNETMAQVPHMIDGLLKEQYDTVSKGIENFETRRDQLASNLNLALGADAAKSLLETPLMSSAQLDAIEALVGKAMGKSPADAGTPAGGVSMTPQQVHEFMNAKDPTTGRFLMDQDDEYRAKAIALNKKMREAQGS